MVAVDGPANADDCLAAECEASKPGPKADMQQNAVAWLQTTLARGARPAKELIDEAREAACIAPATLRRAREELHVEAYRERVPGPCFWRLPQGTQGEPGASKARQPEHLEHLAGNPETFRSSCIHGGQEVHVAIGYATTSFP